MQNETLFYVEITEDNIKSNFNASINAIINDRKITLTEENHQELIDILYSDKDLVNCMIKMIIDLAYSNKQNVNTFNIDDYYDTVSFPIHEIIDEFLREL